MGGKWHGIPEIKGRGRVCDDDRTARGGGHYQTHTGRRRSRNNISYLAGMSPYISLKIKKRHYEHHMIEAHKYLITWISDDIFFKKIV